MCGVCTAAALAGVGLSRWLKIDDTISGLWIGAMLISLSVWTAKWLREKFPKINFLGLPFVVGLIYYAFVIIPFYQKGIIGHPKNVLFEIDKFLLGLIVGSIFFYLGGELYKVIKAKNGGHAQFPFQKVVIPVAVLAVLSGIFYLITK
jgi:hypothetical protein